MQDILQKIVAQKMLEVVAAKQQYSLESIQSLLKQAPPPRDFFKALNAKVQHKQVAVIAEIKQASPSQGVIRENFNPVAIAHSYVSAGATALSILTDKYFFQGSNEYLKQVRAVAELPILRKDFIIDPYQIYEARALGADCILLIAAILSDVQLLEFTQLAQTLQLAVLVEVHDTEELQRALLLPTHLIGINNRDLRTFVTDLKTTIKLSQVVPRDRLVITESGIHTQQDVALLRQQGINAFLIGESFMRAEDPGQKLRELFAE